MLHDTNKSDARDHGMIRGTENDELNYLEQKLGVSRDQVEWAIEAVGNDFEKVEDYIKRNRLI